MSAHSTDNHGTSPAAVPSATLDAVFGAVSHPARRQILVVLYARGGQMTAGQIADRFKHSWPTTTRHLGVLEQAGVLEVTRQGRHRIYALRFARLVQAGQWLMSWADAIDESDRGQPRPLPASVSSYATMRNAIPPTVD